MKILYLTDDFPPQSFGGGGIVAYNFAKAIKNLGHEVYVITAIQNKNDVGRHAQDGLTVFKVYSGYHTRWRAYTSLYNPRVVGKVARIIANIKPDAIHTHNVHQYLSCHCLKLAKESGAKVVLTAHDTMLYSYSKVMDSRRISPLEDFREFKFRYNPFRNFFIRKYLKNADRIIAVSNALREALENNGIKNAGTIHNGIDLADWKTPEDEIIKFKELHNIKGKRVVLFCGRLSGAKGGEVIISAMEKVIREMPLAVLLIAGSKEGYAETMKKNADDKNMADHIVFTGWLSREEMKKAYFASDLVAVPSLYLDPFPTVNLEAMASKKPVIGTCFGGTPEIVVDGKTGYVVNPNNIDAMSEKILSLLGSESEAQRFGQNGYEKVKKEFDLNLQAAKYLKLYLK